MFGPLALYPARSWARYPAADLVSVRESARAQLRGERDPAARLRIRALLRRLPRDSARRFSGLDSGVTVAAGHAATITVAGRDRRHFAWLFDHRAYANADRGYRVADGDAAIRVVGCRRPYGQYHGGFVVDGARCVTVDIAIDGGAPKRRRLAIGSTASC